MSLEAGIVIARTGLGAAATGLAVTSRNIASAGLEGATHKSANLVSLAGGGVLAASIGRRGEDGLLQKVFFAASSSAAQAAVSERLDGLKAITGEIGSDGSPPALIGKLRDALRLYAGAPQNPSSARGALAAAQGVVDALHAGARAVQETREDADQRIGAGVDALNASLGRLESLNGNIVRGTRAARDVTDLMDERDRVLRSMSEEIGISVRSTSDNGVAVYTDSGVVLFDVQARAVEFSRSAALPAGAQGAQVLVDGVPVTSALGGMRIAGGRIAGEIEIRDTLAPVYGLQLDELARGLIFAFAEADQRSAPTLPPAAGLFTWSGGPDLPTATSARGLAASISISANADPARGGDVARIRDGGISDPAEPAYRYNATSAAGFNARIEELAGSIEQSRAFDPAAALGTQSDLLAYSAASVGWLEQARASARTASERGAALFQHASNAHSEKSGVNLDEQMTKLLELERAYQANSKLISVADEMLSTLLRAIG